MNFMRDMTMGTSCSVDGTAAVVNPLTMLINRVFGLPDTAPIPINIIRNTFRNQHEEAEIMNALNSGMGLNDAQIMRIKDRGLEAARACGSAWSTAVQRNFDQAWNQRPDQTRNFDQAWNQRPDQTRNFDQAWNQRPVQQTRNFDQAWNQRPVQPTFQPQYIRQPTFQPQYIRQPTFQPTLQEPIVQAREVNDDNEIQMRMQRDREQLFARTERLEQAERNQRENHLGLINQINEYNQRLEELNIEIQRTRISPNRRGDIIGSQLNAAPSLVEERNQVIEDLDAMYNEYYADAPVEEQVEEEETKQVEEEETKQVEAVQNPAGFEEFIERIEHLNENDDAVALITAIRTSRLSREYREVLYARLYNVAINRCNYMLFMYLFDTVGIRQAYSSDVRLNLRNAIAFDENFTRYKYKLMLQLIERDTDVPFPDVLTMAEQRAYSNIHNFKNEVGDDYSIDDAYADAISNDFVCQKVIRRENDLRIFGD
jgi:hypothetical protein